MDLVTLRRQHITWTIQQNPVEIIIQRTEKMDKGGYFEEIESEHGPYTVRIFQRGMQIPIKISTLGGTKQTDRGWGLLAGHEVEIKAGANVLDEFEVDGLGKFQVLAVYPQIIQGQVVGYQADLKKVS
jgi:hypothetical protein